MKRVEKEQFISELSARLQTAKAAILAEYRGLKVSEITGIRRDIRKGSGDFRVIKNRLAKRVVKGSSWESLQDYFKGPVALAITDSDPVALSKLLTKYGEEFPALKLKVGVMEGAFLDLKKIEALSKLPSKEELHAQLLRTLMASAQGLVRVMNGVPQKLAIALKAIGEKKQ